MTLWFIHRDIILRKGSKFGKYKHVSEAPCHNKIRVTALIGVTTPSVGRRRIRLNI